MAEIDFKRRGTPLWLVLLILLVVGGGAAYFLLDRRPAAPATATAADSAATAVAGTTPGGAPATAAPAAPTGPTEAFTRFADTRRLPTDDGSTQRAYLGEALRLMSDVLQEKAPVKGVQINMLRAIADTLAMPETKAERVPDLVQLAFFAYAYALKDSKVDDGRLATAAGQLQPNLALSKQAQQVNGYLRLSRDLLTGRTPQAADTVRGRTSAPPPKAKTT